LQGDRNGERQAKNLASMPDTLENGTKLIVPIHFVWCAIQESVDPRRQSIENRPGYRRMPQPVGGSTPAVPFGPSMQSVGNL
jgi:hypothetical protein